MTVAVSDCAPRHPAPFVDGLLEMRCPQKLNQVIAAARCLERQAGGCTCPVKATEIVRLGIERAKTPTSPPREWQRGRSSRNKDARNARIREMVEAGVPLMKIAKEHRLSRDTVKQIAGGGSR